MPSPTLDDAPRYFAAVREALRRGGGRTDAAAVRAVALATLFDPKSPVRLAFDGPIAEESAFVAWSRALEELA